MTVDFRLCAGDRVALIAPASGQKEGQEHFVEKAWSLLTDWGLEVVVMPSDSRAQRSDENVAQAGSLGYLSAGDEIRKNDLLQALADPTIKALFVTRGGYGCARLVRFLPSLVVPTKKFLIGFSDITTLHLALAKEAHVISVHAPNIATEQMLGYDAHDENGFVSDAESNCCEINCAEINCAEINHAMLYKSLFGRARCTNHAKGREPAHNAIHATDNTANNTSDNTAALATLDPVLIHLAGEFGTGDAHYSRWSELHKGNSVGGCLSLLVTSLGTSHEIETCDNILMIEEVGESPYKIDRMLTHLANAGKLTKPRAVVFGDMVNCDTSTISWRDVVRDHFQGASFPVYETMAFGHGKINLPWYYC